MLRHKGFTLIELAVALAVIAILSAIAYPSYAAYVTRAKRAEARTALLGLLQAEERYRANCEQYADKVGTVDSCAPGSYSIAFSGRTENGLYNLTISEATTTSFTAVATVNPAGSQKGDRQCLNLTLVQTAGNVTKTPSACW